MLLPVTSNQCKKPPTKACSNLGLGVGGFVCSNACGWGLHTGANTQEPQLAPLATWLVVHLMIQKKGCAPHTTSTSALPGTIH